MMMARVYPISAERVYIYMMMVWSSGCGCFVKLLGVGGFRKIQERCSLEITESRDV